MKVNYDVKKSIFEILIDHYNKIINNRMNNPFGSPYNMPGFNKNELCLSCTLDRIAQELPMQNLEHIAENLSRVPGNLEILKNSNNMKIRVLDKLYGLDHTYRYVMEEGKPDDVLDAKPLQLLRCYILLGALQTRRTIEEIGELVELNPKDEKTEMGGIVNYNVNGQLKFNQFNSSTKEDLSYGHNKRNMMRNPHVALFHLHAVYDDCTNFAGPSYDEENGDIESAIDQAKEENEAHHVVITKLKGRNFNVDYYGAEMQIFNPNVAVIDLGNYSY